MDKNNGEFSRKFETMIGPYVLRARVGGKKMKNEKLLKCKECKNTKRSIDMIKCNICGKRFCIECFYTHPIFISDGVCCSDCLLFLDEIDAHFFPAPPLNKYTCVGDEVLK